MWNLQLQHVGSSSPTRDPTWALSIGSMEPEPLNRSASPYIAPEGVTNKAWRLWVFTVRAYKTDMRMDRWWREMDVQIGRVEGQRVTSRNQGRSQHPSRVGGNSETRARSPFSRPWLRAAPTQDEVISTLRLLWDSLLLKGKA